MHSAQMLIFRPLILLVGQKNLYACVRMRNEMKGRAGPADDDDALPGI